MEQVPPVSQEVVFPNGNRAHLIAPSPGSSPSEILKALRLENPECLLLLVGGAEGIDESLHARLLQLCSRGIARAVDEAGAVIIDGGTDAGIMAMIGWGVADRGRRSALLGVAPQGAVTYPGGTIEASAKGTVPLDANHSHFALAQGAEWGSETDLMYALADHLAKGVPVLTLLINGGAVAVDEVLRTVRRGWPVLVLERTGRLADDIARVCFTKPAFIEDAALAEIVADGVIDFFPGAGTAEQLERRILRFLSKNTTLRLAWERYVVYDENAIRHQSTYRNIQVSVLFLSVVATALALTQAQLGKGTFSEFFHYAIVLMPITISILVAVGSRLKQGNKWVLLRAGAEAIKREIFRYRARSKEYGDGKQPPEAVLAEQVGIITRRLMRTEVNVSALRVPNRGMGKTPSNDDFRELTPEKYVALRLDDQLRYYWSKTATLEKRLKCLCWLIYGFGGVGTFLAAVGAQLWVAMTTTLVGTFTTYLEYQQIENTLMKYNQAATDLANIRTWWSALSEEEKEDREHYEILVENTERVLKSELSGWVQRMEDALARLKAEQAEVARGKREGREQAKPKPGTC